MSSIEVRDAWYRYEDDWSRATMTWCNTNVWGYYNIGIDLIITDDTILVDRSGTINIYDWKLKFSMAKLSELPPRLDGQWYAVFDPKYFKYFEKLSDGSWIEHPAIRTDNSVEFAIRLFAAGTKTGSIRMFYIREARYIKGVM